MKVPALRTTPSVVSPATCRVVPTHIQSAHQFPLARLPGDTADSPSLSRFQGNRSRKFTKGHIFKQQGKGTTAYPSP